MLTPQAFLDGTRGPDRRSSSLSSGRAELPERRLGEQAAQVVAEALTPVLARLLPHPSPDHARMCTVLRYSTSGGLLGTRCDVRVRRVPGGWLADGRADHVLGLPHADTVLMEALGGKGETLLVLLPTDAPGLARTEHQPSPLPGASFGSARLDSVSVPDTAALHPSPTDLHTLYEAIATTRLRLARLATDLAADAVATAIDHVARRPFGGAHLVDKQVVRHALVEATAQVRMCDAYLRRVDAPPRTTSARQRPWTAGERAVPPACSFHDAATRAAAYVAVTAPQAVEASCQLHGGYGFLEEKWIARAYQDSVFIPVLLGGLDHLDRATGLPFPVAVETVAE
ncbi:acyl-CoA dehydrogenase family protein [Streptomyces sp. NPDC006465]|uniref:acyl-CoA dehydrogenase family protein n=1 Tax=Streptomyces sp. NPDC006465 TaxID=3157174 RepID=UPI0033AFC471